VVPEVAPPGEVGGDFDNRHLEHLQKLGFFGFHGACHAKELRVELEEGLVGDLGGGHGAGLDVETLFYLDCLVDSF
jgi:hypothetical protein